MDRTDAKISTPETQARSATVHAIDSELDYLGKLIAKCRHSWPAQAQLTNWNNGKGEGHKICTQENFGCVRFLQQAPGA